MERFFAILADGVHRFEGTVDKFTGDGIMALFGAPIAHEDHAQRACYAALQMLDDGRRVRGRAAPRARASTSRSGSASTPARSSSARSATSLRMDYTAIGHTVGLAQRMEQLAEPGNAYLTEHTAALVDGYLDLEDLGEFEIKGAAPGASVYELAASARRARGSGPRAARGLLDVRRPRRGDGGAGAALERGDAAGDGAGHRVVGEAGRRQEPAVRRVRAALPGAGIAVYRSSGQAHGEVDPVHAGAPDDARATSTIGEPRLRPAARETIAGSSCSRRAVRRRLSGPVRVPRRARSRAPAPAAWIPRRASAGRSKSSKRLVHAQSARVPGVRVVRGPALAGPGQRGVRRQLRRRIAGGPRTDHSQFPSGLSRRLDVNRITGRSR